VNLDKFLIKKLCSSLVSRGFKGKDRQGGILCDVIKDLLSNGGMLENSEVRRKS
jgi:hypothetical protein